MTITGFAASGVTCAIGYTGTVTYTVCGSAGTDYTLGGCEATCDVPTATGYVTTGAAGTATITGFAPSGVTCVAGYTGTVTYTVCGSAGTDYTLGGCEATSPFDGVFKSNEGNEYNDCGPWHIGSVWVFG